MWSSYLVSVNRYMPTFLGRDLSDEFHTSLKLQTLLYQGWFLINWLRFFRLQSDSNLVWTVASRKHRGLVHICWRCHQMRGKHLSSRGHIWGIGSRGVVVDRDLLLLQLGLVLKVIDHLVLQLLPLRLRHYYIFLKWLKILRLNIGCPPTCWLSFIIDEDYLK